jgi:hypothetical protein
VRAQRNTFSLQCWHSRSETPDGKDTANAPLRVIKSREHAPTLNYFPYYRIRKVQNNNNNQESKNEIKNYNIIIKVLTK